MEETKDEAEKSFDFFYAYEDKYPKVTECLAKVCDELIALYDFPAEYLHHIRTTSHFDSTFTMVILRTTKTLGCFSRKED